MLNARTNIDYMVCVFLLWSYRGDTRTIYNIALYARISVFKRFVLCLVCVYTYHCLKCMRELYGWLVCMLYLLMCMYKRVTICMHVSMSLRAVVGGDRVHLVAFGQFGTQFFLLENTPLSHFYLIKVR